MARDVNGEQKVILQFYEQQQVWCLCRGNRENTGLGGPPLWTASLGTHPWKAALQRETGDCSRQLTQVINAPYS